MAQLALEIEARRHGVYHAAMEELQAIDDALAALSRGEVASGEEVEAGLRKIQARMKVRFSKLALDELDEILSGIR